MAETGRLKDEDLVEGLSVWYLKASGLWGIFNHYRETRGKSAVFTAWMVGSVIGFGPLFLTSAVGPFFTANDLEGMTLVILNPLSALQMAVKFTVLWFGLDTQMHLLDLMRNNYLTCVPASRQARAKDILKKAAKKANFMANMGIAANAITVSFWNIFPILRSDYVRLTLGITFFGEPKDHNNKILGFWYPVNHKETPWTQILYVYEFIICFWAGFIITLLEALIAQQVVLLAAYLEVIQYLMSELKKTQSAYLDNKTLLSFIIEHQRLMRVGDEMRQLYNFLITMTLSTGLIILIISIFNFFLGTGKGDIILTIKFVIYTMYTLVEVCVYCYAGVELETTSKEVGFAAYNCDWYVMGPDFRKTLQMMMIRTGSPVSLKAGKLYPVNLTTLTNILQVAYSTSTILFRITNKDNTGLDMV
uniref:Odorant receptor n=1 Tax=Adelphocoris lineolatus TaxID=236346 RepID=A0A2I4PHG6_ADELI|nr:olfactory receptor 66 [Adelphocoris lineolatus]